MADNESPCNTLSVGALRATRSGIRLLCLLSGTTSVVSLLDFAQDSLLIRPATAEETLQETPFTGSNDLPIHSHFILPASPRRHCRLETQAFLYQCHEPRGTIPVSSGLTVDDLNLHGLPPVVCSVAPDQHLVGPFAWGSRYSQHFQADFSRSVIKSSREACGALMFIHVLPEVR
jgi:hypothetical protein